MINLFLRVTKEDYEYMFERAKALSVETEPEDVVSAVVRPVPVRPSVICSNPFAKKPKAAKNLEQAKSLYRQVMDTINQDNIKKDRKRRYKEAQISNIPKKLQVVSIFQNISVQLQW